MCGILGNWSTYETQSLRWFDQALAELGDRGPDGCGKEILDQGRLALGHTRLSIIDTSDQGRQPLANEDGSVWITFNGEIYNYRDLRRQLVDCGHVFRTATDTEVIVHAYEQWGRDSVLRLRGIFAFAIWDQTKERLFLARSRRCEAAVLCPGSASFAFASQPKAIISAPSFSREICPDAFRDYLAFSYVPDPGCIFRGIQKLRPGHFLEVTRDAVQTTRYWELKYQPTISDFGEARDAIGDALAKSVDAQLVSDVPVGSLLSGGIDSTLVTGLASERSNPAFGRFRSFTLGFDEPSSDERQYAQIAADHFQTAHYVHELVGADLPAQLEEAICSFDEPFDPNGPLPATRIAQLVRSTNTKVVLGGDGGDELFAGYLRYDAFNAHRQSSARLRKVIRRLLSNTPRSDRDVAEFFKHEGVCTTEMLAEIMPARFSQAWFSEALSGITKLYDKHLPAVTACQLIDFNHYLPGHILTKVDRATMHYGVEARVPFLDPDLAELAFRIVSEVNYQNGERKAALKAAAANYLPPKLMSGRKKGFSSPIEKWSTQPFQQWAKQKIETGMLVASDLVRRDAAQSLLQQPSHKRFRAFWLLLAAELWAEKWLVADEHRLTIPNQIEISSRSSDVAFAS